MAHSFGTPSFKIWWGEVGWLVGKVGWPLVGRGVCWPLATTHSSLIAAVTFICHVASRLLRIKISFILKSSVWDQQCNDDNDDKPPSGSVAQDTDEEKTPSPAEVYANTLARNNSQFDVIFPNMEWLMYWYFSLADLWRKNTHLIFSSSPGYCSW